MTNETITAVDTKKAQFDLASIDTIKDANNGAEIELFHPTEGTDLDIHIGLLGKDSDKFRQVQAQQGRKRTQKLQKTGFRIGIGADEIEQDAIELLASVTTGWRNMVMGGKEVPFSYENAVVIYTKYPWIREQVDAAVGDRSRFTTA
jgi:hypothetical protein